MLSDPQRFGSNLYRNDFKDYKIVHSNQSKLAVVISNYTEKRNFFSLKDAFLTNFIFSFSKVILTDFQSIFNRGK